MEAFINANSLLSIINVAKSKYVSKTSLYHKMNRLQNLLLYIVLKKIIDI